MNEAPALRSGWVALALTLVARTALGILASLLLWSVIPIALGWQPTVVMTGSMLPRLVPGDVVLSRPVAPAQIALGEILLYDDPDQAAHLRMHRFVAVDPDGRLVTKGDANPANDSTPITRSVVHGVASLRVPFIARPVLWVQSGDVVSLAGTVVALGVLVALACWFKAADADTEPTDTEPTDTEPTDTGPSDPGAPGQTLAPVGAHRRPGGVDHDPSPRRVLALHRSARVAVVTAVVAVLGVAFAGSAEAVARFAGTTASPTNTWAAATYFTCTAAVQAGAPRMALPLADSASPFQFLFGTTLADISGHGNTGTTSNGLGSLGFRVAGPCPRDSGTALHFGGNAQASTPLSISNPGSFTEQVWFQTTGTSNGTLLSATTGSTSTLGLGVDSTRHLTFGVRTATGTATVTSSTAYAADTWHLATATMGSAGMALYLDGALVGTNATTSTASITGGQERLGYSDASDVGLTGSDYLTGSLAFAAYFPTVLSAAQVGEQYAAGS